MIFLGFNLEGEAWKTQRRFALVTLRDLGFGRPIIEPRIKDEAEYMLEEMDKTNGIPIDVAPFLSNAISNVICTLVFGRRFPYEDETFRELLKLLRSRFGETQASFLSPFVMSKPVAIILKLLVPKVVF